MEDEHPAKEQHENPPEKCRPPGECLRHMNLVETPNRQTEYDEVIDHIEEDVDGHEVLCMPKTEIIDLDDLSEGLRIADRAGKLDDID